MTIALEMWLIGSLICIALFVIGRWFSRTDKPAHQIEWPGKPTDDPEELLRRTHQLGKLFMIVSPIFFVFWTLLLFGVLGHVEGVEPIKLH